MDLTNLPRPQLVALMRRAYELSLKEVIKGNTDPALKRELAATRQRLAKEKAK